MMSTTARLFTPISALGMALSLLLWYAARRHTRHEAHRGWRHA